MLGDLRPGLFRPPDPRWSMDTARIHAAGTHDALSISSLVKSGFRQVSADCDAASRRWRRACKRARFWWWGAECA
jgi:hypothetical protein